nr:cytochrome P450 CYP6EP1 [Bemisia tabaci]
MDLLTDSFSFPINPFLVLIGATLLAFYYMPLNYWARRGIPHVSALRCIFQTLAVTLRTKSFHEMLHEQHKALEGHPYGGAYLLFRPTVILRDPELVKEWLVKGFAHFHDHVPKPDEKSSKLAGNLFALGGDRWRAVRTKVSPAFSPATVRFMHRTLEGCALELSSHLQRVCGAEGEAEIDMKSMAKNCAMDIIGACAVGVNCNALGDPEHCEMKPIVEEIFGITWRSSVANLLTYIHPRLPAWIRFPRRTPEVEQFVAALTRRGLQMSAEERAGRRDFLKILVESREAEKLAAENCGAGGASEDEDPVFTENIIAGVVGLFLSAGLENVAVTVTFCMFEIAHQPDIQEKMFDEIQAMKQETGREINYDDLKKLEYIEQVVNETLRKYPADGYMRRICTKPFKIPSTSVVVEENTKLFISTYSIHHDSKYFPEPEKFDPERFSEQNIDKIVPGSYLAFGKGPRACIARHWALTAVKTVVVTLVSNYKLYPCARTQKRIEFDLQRFNLTPKGEVCLRIVKRDAVP